MLNPWLPYHIQTACARSLDPARISRACSAAARRISVTAWDMLAKNSGPDLQALGPNDLCEDCCELVDQSRLDKAGYSSARARVADRITQAASKDFVPSTGFYISRTWAMYAFTFKFLKHFKLSWALHATLL